MDEPTTWRNRTKTSQTQTKATLRTYSNNFPAGPQTRFKENGTGIKGTTSLMSDNNHLNFEARRKNGEIIMGDMMLSKSMRDYLPASLSYRIAPTYEFDFGGDFASQVIGSVSVPSTFSDQTISNLKDAALIEAYAKITQDSVMSSEILVGLGQTINMLRSPFSQSRKHLERMYKSASRHYGKTADSVTKANASAWLEYRYGMLPLYLDGNQVIKIYTERHKSLEKRRAVVRSSKKLEMNVSSSFTGVALPVLYNIGYQLYASGSVVRQRTVAAHGGVMYEVAPRTRAQELAVQFQLGSSAILPGLWEQIPFSFVADWFYNVGDWLAANNLPPDVTVRGNWCTSIDEIKDVYSCSDFYTYANSVKRTGSWGTGFKETTVVKRKTNSQLSSLPVTTQRWATVTHALDAVALLLNPIKDLVTLLRK